MAGAKSRPNKRYTSGITALLHGLTLREPFRVSSKRWSVSVLKNMKYRGKNKGALVFKSANECKQLNKRLLTVSSNEFRETFLLSVCTVSDGMQLDFKSTRSSVLFERALLSSGSGVRVGQINDIPRG